MNAVDDSECNILRLDDDERDHLRKVSGDILDHLQMAENAAVICLNGLQFLRENLPIYEPKGHVLLLLAKSARNARFAVKGLKLGYYSGVSAVLRSAFEDLTYAVLINSQPSQLAKLYRSEFSPKISFEERRSYQETQKREAKEALFSQESSPTIIRDALREYCDKANFNIHTSIRGLLEEFGIDVECLVPKELREELLKYEGNQMDAFDNFVLKTCLSDNIRNERFYENESADEPIYIELSGRYGEETLSDLAFFPFYIAHRLLDFTREIFDIESEDFHRQYKAWHKAIKDLGLSAGH